MSPAAFYQLFSSQVGSVTTKTKLSLVVCWLAVGAAMAHDAREVSVQNDCLVVRISPNGAELTSLKSRRTNREFLWQGNPEFWSDHAPIMFPVNVRFKDDRYTHGDESYVIPKMGLAIYRPFQVIPTDRANEAKLELTANSDTLRQYPFHFRLQVTYRLDGCSLTNEFTVENQGDEVMPFALGGHPGFAFPLSDRDRREDFEYWFSQQLTIDRNEIAGSLIQPNVVPFLKNESTLSFGDARIPDGGLLLLNSRARKIGLAKRGEQPFVTVDLGDFPNANLWSPPGFPFACIEPMIGHHDYQESPESIEAKDYLIRLPAGERKTYRFTISVQESRP